LGPEGDGGASLRGDRVNRVWARKPKLLAKVKSWGGD